ncbi:hypothetical protein BDN72DRAFT_897552 [Pluteus cervinus]|uniref:Uncharacterized protein n=1 Tax=Pluteus cervinus TaxID=181527 RepID=A0ACD3AVU1_9AGAR|nr:hypothetical protein BDN72DRAFT_897552 [Pluteus cervinus]
MPREKSQPEALTPSSSSSPSALNPAYEDGIKAESSRSVTSPVNTLDADTQQPQVQLHQEILQVSHVSGTIPVQSRQASPGPNHTITTTTTTTTTTSATIAMSGAASTVSGPTPVAGRRTSLKRKSLHDQSEDADSSYGYPRNLKSLYPPNKRSRTPSSESADETPANTDEPVVQPAPSPQESQVETQVSTTTELVSTPPQTLQELPPVQLAPPQISRPTTPPPPVQATPTLITPLPSTPRPTFGLTSSVGSQSPPRTPLPRGFASFAGSASPFAPLSKPSPSPFGLKPGSSIWGSSSTSAAAWASPNRSSSALNAIESQEKTDTATDNEGGSDSDKDEVKSSKVEEKSQEKEKKKKGKESSHAIDEATPEGDLKETSNQPTGEENEDVELELKGVKLFTSRGNKGYTSGMLGHVKLLSNKTTLEERLLFRREPLWQVTMNVRMHPLLRCSYDEEENVLRVVMTEFIEKKDVPQSEWKTEVVVYALKPGRACSKKNFKEFAESLLESSQLKARKT